MPFGAYARLSGKGSRILYKGPALSGGWETAECVSSSLWGREMGKEVGRWMVAQKRPREEGPPSHTQVLIPVFAFICCVTLGQSVYLSEFRFPPFGDSYQPRTVYFKAPKSIVEAPKCH